MSIGTPTKTTLTAKTLLNAASVLVGFAATMLAFRAFGNLRPGWGAYNLAIALVALVTFVAVRARADAA